MANVRLLALDVLLKIEEENSYSAICLNNSIKENKLGGLDTSFITRLVYGVIERKITLDYIIRSYSKIRLKKIEPTTLMILRLGMYQLLYMDKVPASAAVNESVMLAKRKGLFKSSGFINGILRSFVRDDLKYELPKDRVKSLSVQYSCPEDIIKMWHSSYGENLTYTILNSLADKPEIYCRVNTLKTTQDKLIANFKKESVSAEKTIIDNCLKLTDTGTIDYLNSYKKGEFFIQDISSQIAIEILSPKENETIIDVCAAPGGKSLNSAIRMNNKGTVYSFDVFDHKLKLICQNANRLGVSILSSDYRDAQCDDEFDVLADKVICDVPCDGLGLIRRKPEIRYKNNLMSNKINDLQYDILSNSSRLVKKGGILMYSTCSLSREENNEIVRDFLSENSDFKPLELKLPQGISRMTDEETNCLTIFPGTIGSDGFFVSLMVRE